MVGASMILAVATQDAIPCSCKPTKEPAMAMQGAAAVFVGRVDGKAYETSGIWSADAFCFAIKGDEEGTVTRSDPRPCPEVRLRAAEGARTREVVDGSRGAPDGRAAENEVMRSRGSEEGEKGTPDD
jgi:hypothetical protein